MSDLVRIVARAIRDEAYKFNRPVYFYVEGEARHRWEEANPEGDWYADAPITRRDIDDDMESWAILARAALAALAKETT